MYEYLSRLIYDAPPHAANGIGRATAFAYAKAGVDGLYLIDVNREALETVKTELLAATKTPGFRVEIEVVNVTNEVQVEKMAENFVKAFGRMDYAANIAGVWLHCSLRRLSYLRTDLLVFNSDL